jgi:hypothetical protein
MPDTPASNPNQQHVDRNVTFTQASTTVWEIIDSDNGAVIGHVERSEQAWTAYDRDNAPMGKHASPEIGMFSILSDSQRE